MFAKLSGHYRRSTDPRDDMDEPHTHDADRRRTQRSTGCTSPLIETARTGKTTGGSVAAAESWGAVGGEEEGQLVGTGFPWGQRMALELNRGADGTLLRIY